MNTVPAFWRLLGPNLVGVAAVFGLTLFNGLNSDLTRLRAEVAALQEGRGEYATAASVASDVAELESRLRECEGTAGDSGYGVPADELPVAG